MTDEDDELKRLRDETEAGDRLDQAADERNQTHDQLVQAICDALDDLESGDTQKTISIWDGQLAALLTVLEDHPEEMERVAAQLEDELDSEVDQVDRSTVIRLAIWLGLQESSPEVVAALREAIQQHAVKDI